VASLTFLGTGNFLAPGRYWNGFVIDGTILVEPSPTALPNLRRCGFRAEELDCVVISHFHPDHTFGWPFLLLELVERARGRRLEVVGPPGVSEYLDSMMRLGSVMEIQKNAHAELDIRYTEADGSWQEAGNVRLRAVEVEHVPDLRCFGYVFDRGGRLIGYSGDTRPCAGLDRLAEMCDVLVLECNGVHASKTHMDTEAVAALRDRFAHVRIVLTHLGETVASAGLTGVTIPDDFDTLADL
jgi:ribonuclease Z